MANNCHADIGWIISLFFIVLSFNGRFVSAAEINIGNVQGNLDTTLAFGILHRVQSPAADLISRASGGDGFSANIDDGNLNYRDLSLIHISEPTRPY